MCVHNDTLDQQRATSHAVKISLINIKLFTCSHFRSTKHTALKMMPATVTKFSRQLENIAPRTEQFNQQTNYF